MGTITITAEGLTSWLCQDPGWRVSWPESGFDLLKLIPEGMGLQIQRSWEISTRPVEGRAACPGPSRHQCQTTGQLHYAASSPAERGGIEIKFVKARPSWGCCESANTVTGVRSPSKRKTGIPEFTGLLTGRITMEALGASSSSTRVLFMSSAVNTRRGNMVAIEKLP